MTFLGDQHGGWCRTSDEVVRGGLEVVRGAEEVVRNGDKLVS